jgi:hypothetical protein
MMSHHIWCRRVVVAGLSCVSVSVMLYAADPPKTDKSSDQITVRGCLQGLVLTIVDDSGTNSLRPHTFNLTGDRNMLKTLKTHSGHIDEVTGVLKAGKSTSDGFVVKEKPIDKGRVYIGAGKAPLYDDTPIPAASIDVREFVHIDDSRCS